MAVPFSASGKTNPQNATAPLLYYPRAGNSGAVDLDVLAENISKKCTVTEADCYAVIISLEAEITTELEQGKIVRMGQLGSFQVSVKGSASSTATAVDAGSIKSSSMIFKPGKRLKTMLQNLKFYKI